MNSLLVKVEKPEVTHAMVTYRLSNHGDVLLVEYGNIRMGDFVPYQSESLLLDKHPELHGIFTWETELGAWDIDKVTALVQPSGQPECDKDTQPIEPVINLAGMPDGDLEHVYDIVTGFVLTIGRLQYDGTIPRDITMNGLGLLQIMGKEISRRQQQRAALTA